VNGCFYNKDKMNIEEAKEQLQSWINYMKNNKEKVNKADLIINCLETVLQELDNSISKDKVKEKIEEFNNKLNIRGERQNGRTYAIYGKNELLETKE